MTMKQILLAAGLALVAGPAAADCADRITFLEEVLDESAKLAISASSGGQGVAGAREAQAISEEDAEDEAVPYQDEPEALEAVEEAEEAGDGGDDILQARAHLSEARNLADEGDEEACITQVRDVLVQLIQP